MTIHVLTIRQITGCLWIAGSLSFGSAIILQIIWDLHDYFTLLIGCIVFMMVFMCVSIPVKK